MTTTVHDDLIAVIRDLTEREVLPRVEALDAAAPEAIAQVWQRLVDLDLDRALLAEDLGGVGLDVEDFLGVLHEVAVGDGGIALTVLLHNAAIVSMPAEMARDLPAGARWTLALGPGAGEPAAGRIELVPNGLTGRMAAVFAAVGADGVVVTTLVPEPGVFPVPAGAGGLTVTPDVTQMGLRAARCADLEFAGVRVCPVPGPDGVAVNRRAGCLVHAGVAVIATGIARRARRIALAYAHTRIQGGVPIIEHGAVADMLARMAVRSRILTDAHLGAVSGDPAAALAHKIAACDAAMATATDAVQVMGGIGYMVDTGVEKLMRDAKYCQLYPQPPWLARRDLIHLDFSQPGARGGTLEL